jgi:AcrR family transcriptional regulator
VTAAIAPEPPRPRGRPKADEIAELEARLIRVARQVFVARGYGATSMSEVARAARISKTTLYSRFASKGDLFRAIVDEQIRRAGLGRPTTATSAAASLEDELRAYAEHMTRISLGGDLYQVNRLIYSEAARFPELGEAAWQRARVGVAQVAELIRNHAERDGVLCRDPDGAAEVYIQMLRGWYHEHMLTNRPVSPTEMKAAIDRIVGIFTGGRANW